MNETERWQLVVATFDCPFCGRKKGRMCMRLKENPLDDIQDMIKPHEPRMKLLEEQEAGLPGRGFQ